MLGGRRAHVLVATVAGGVALFASGCGERAEPVGAQTDLYPVTITAAGDRLFTIRVPAERIAVLDRSARDIVVALGARDRLAGMVASVDDLGHLRPDLVVAPSVADEKVLSQAAAVTNAPVYVTPDTSIREVERAITQLGLITAEPAAARRLVHDIEQRRRDITRRLRGAAQTSVFVDLGDFTTASDQTLIGDLVREARGRNIAADVPDGLPLNVAELLRLDPDVYVATTDSGTSLAMLRKHQSARVLRAVRRGQVVVVDSRLLEPGPAIGRGLERLAEALHPGATG